MTCIMLSSRVRKTPSLERSSAEGFGGRVLGQSCRRRSSSPWAGRDTALEAPFRERFIMEEQMWKKQCANLMWRNSAVCCVCATTTLALDPAAPLPDLAPLSIEQPMSQSSCRAPGGLRDSLPAG